MRRNVPISAKYRKAIDLASDIIGDGYDVNVSDEDIQRWPVRDLYEWLESWGFRWDGSRWVSET